MFTFVSQRLVFLESSILDIYIEDTLDQTSDRIQGMRAASEL